MVNKHTVYRNRKKVQKPPVPQLLWALILGSLISLRVCSNMCREKMRCMELQEIGNTPKLYVSDVARLCGELAGLWRSSWFCPERTQSPTAGERWSTATLCFCVACKRRRRPAALVGRCPPEVRWSPPTSQKERNATTSPSTTTTSNRGCGRCSGSLDSRRHSPTMTTSTQRTSSTASHRWQLKTKK